MNNAAIFHVQMGDTLPAAARGAVVAIGNFDGVHRGHVALIAQARDVARRLGAPVGVLTFEPHPRQYFQPLAAPFRLTPPAQKLERLAASGVDAIYVHDFNSALAHMTADDFVRDVLIGQLGVRAVVIGPDFHFGKGRAGHADTLRAAGIDVHVMPPLCDEVDEVISATRIRSLIQQGDIATATALLGWEWDLTNVLA